MIFVFEKATSYGNVILEKSFNFSKRIIKLYEYIIKNNFKLDPLYKQLLRSGTSIGANIYESQSAFTKKDFINKLGVSLKEARETEYWLRLLKETEHLGIKEFENINNDCTEIIRLLTSIIKTAKMNSV